MCDSQGEHTDAGPGGCAVDGLDAGQQGGACGQHVVNQQYMFRSDGFGAASSASLIVMPVTAVMPRAM